LSHSEDGTRCAELRPLLSAYCDGEAKAEDGATVREHLRACAGCRATMRAYRAAPAAVAALAPALPASRSLLERAQELLGGLQVRFGGARGVGGTATGQVAAGGAGGAGMAAFAKGLAICAAVGGTATCVATGVAPAPFDLGPQHTAPAKIERLSQGALDNTATPVVDEPAPPATEASQQPQPSEQQAKPKPEAATAPEPEEPAGAVEYSPPTEPVSPAPEPASPAASEPSAASNGSAAGEFGP
jgi:Putative zinc-finger